MGTKRIKKKKETEQKICFDEEQELFNTKKEDNERKRDLKNNLLFPIIISLISCALNFVLNGVNAYNITSLRTEILNIQENINVDFHDKQYNNCTFIFGFNAFSDMIIPRECMAAETDINYEKFELKSTDIIKDINGVTHSFAELKNTPLMLAYEEDGKQIFFYGKFNDNYHWSDLCTTNVYEDGRLVGANTSTYVDGICTKSEVFWYADNEWAYVNRARMTTGTSCGETYVYYGDFFERQKIRFDAPDVSLMKSANEWNAQAGLKVNKYYNGETSKQLYNDNSGNAYMLSYDQNGDINCVMRGRFEDGNLNDDTGNAWQITRVNKKDLMQKYILYYDGYFVDGHAQDNCKSEVYLKSSTLNNMAKQYSFLQGCEWREDLLDMDEKIKY